MRETGLVALATAVLSVASADSLAMEVRSFSREGSGGRLTAEFTVRARPERVFETLIDDERFAEFMPFVIESSTLARARDRATVKMRVRRLGLFDFTVVYERRYQAMARKVSWHEIGGFFKRDDGTWTVEPGGDGSRVTYEILLDPGFYVPDFLLAFALRQGLPELGEAIRRRAESGGKWRRSADNRSGIGKQEGALE